MTDSPSDARLNRERWDAVSDSYQERHRDMLGRLEPRWGMWQLPERELQILGDVAGKDVLEYGCGAAQWSILLAKEGARPVGMDNSARQLEHAHRLLGEAGVEFPLVHASAGEVPFGDASFDVVFCDHGAMTFQDPDITVPEVARLLRPGGLLAFSHTTPLSQLCWRDGEDVIDPELHRPYFGLGRIEWEDEPVAFTRTQGGWIHLFRAHGLVVERLHEVQPPEGAASTYRDEAQTAWAHRWPMEQIWVVRKNSVRSEGSSQGGRAGDSALRFESSSNQAVELSDHAARNRAEWNVWAAEYVEAGRRHWAGDEMTWGMTRVAEARIGVLPDVDGRDVLEAGCGTAYVSAWLARRGARMTGIDVSDEQLATARRFQQEFGLEFPLVHGSAESLPFADASFDLVVSEYGASIWADPYVWLPEAARVLRPGGHIVLLVNGTLLMLCMPERDADLPAGTRFQRPYFGMHRFEWLDDNSVDFHLGYGDWIALFRHSGFEVEDLVELEGDADAEPSRHNLFTPAWAAQWPAEEIWRARKL